MKLTKGYTLIAGLLTLAAGIMTVSCSDSDTPGEAPRAIASNPQNGAHDIASGAVTVEIEFDQKVTLAPRGFAQVTIDNAEVTRVSPTDETLRIYISNVQKDRQYTLHIGKGTVLGETEIENEPIDLSFTTVPSPGAEVIDAAMCTPNPTPEAKRLYEYMRGIYGKATLASTMANVSWNIAEAELVKNEIGAYPAIAFFDYIHLHYSPTSWIDYNDTAVVENWWNEGGIPGAMWHWRVPASEGNTDIEKYTYAPDQTTFRPKNILVEGTWERATALADLEEMADYLLLLQAKGIPMLWRPLHEAAGNTHRGGSAWFWWDADGGDTYVALWRFMRDFFDKKGVRNLIWIWTTELDDRDFYPGDEYVDIIGRDLYSQQDPIAVAAEYDRIYSEYPNKMIALSECGGVARMSEQWNAGARWSFFMPWYQNNATTLAGHGSADTEWWQDALSQDFIINRNTIE